MRFDIAARGTENAHRAGVESSYSDSVTKARLDAARAAPGRASDRASGRVHRRLAAAVLGFSLIMTQGWVQARPPTFADGPVRYTVSVDSKWYGQAQQSRVIRSGQVDDFTWKSTPPGGPVAMPARCPGYSSAPLDVDHALLRLVQVRLAPIVAEKASTAELQVSFVGHTPHGISRVKGPAGKLLECPEDLYSSEMRHLTLPLDGKPHLLALNDSTQISISATAVMP